MTAQRIWCPNEDANGNTQKDPGEDVNNSGALASGILRIKVEYSQRFATWLAYKVQVTTSVGGSEGLASRLFVTDFLEADKNNGSFLSPAYGVHSCTAAN